MSLLLLFRPRKYVPPYVPPYSGGGQTIGGRSNYIKEDWLKQRRIKQDDNDLMQLMALVMPILE